MSTSATSGQHVAAASGDSSSNVSEASSATDLQSNNAAKATDEGPLNPPGSKAVGEADEGEKEPGWLVTSCDVGTTEPRSLSQELERLQVLKSYHNIMDPERDEAFDRLTRMASRVLETPYTFLSLVDMGRIWFRSNPDSDCEQQLTRDLLSALARVIMKNDAVFDIPDINLDDRFRQGGDASSTATSNSDSSATQFRFLAGAPLMSPEGYRLGAVCMLSTEPRPDGVKEIERENLKDFADLFVKTMVDRRKLTTQENPSHLVACTAHDLITPLTGIQLSLSLLQQDGDFQEKLGGKREEHISAAVRSSNMMLRICQSTIDTLRGNRKIPAGTDWSLPRNLMQIAEASPFIDMKEFTTNLEAISNSIPKKVPLMINLHPSAPSNIVSDGLKIFRSALNLLSNACTRAKSGSIVMTIYDDEDGSLVFECEDSGKEIETRDSQSLFNQDNDAGNFGLYSVAYQITWLGGKYGIRKRAEETAGDVNMEGVAETAAKDKKTNDKINKKHTVFWFSVPIVLPQDVSELMGLAKSLSVYSEEVSIPTFKAELPVTPPASPQIDETPEFLSPSIPKGIVKKVGNTRTWNALIIEDSTTVRKILGRALSKLGYQVFEAVDGMEGLRELKTTMFDMVLCDFLMPVMDGLDCVKQYREWEVTNRQVFRQYIVGISAHASRNDIERGLKLGMDDFKPKPIVLKTLTGLHESASLRAVRSALDNLLDLPSMEVKPSMSSGTLTVPATLKETIVENGDNTPLFAIPGPRDVRKIGEDEKEDDRVSPLFAVPRRPSQIQKDSPPLFSIPIALTESGGNPPKGRSSSLPIFSIPKRQETDKTSPKGESNPAPLFTIPSSKESGKSGASPLFSIPEQSNESGKTSSKGGSNPAPLFAIPSSQESGKSGASPLFSIQAQSNESGKTSPKREPNPAPLFAIPSSKETGKPTASPLFSIPTKKNEAGKTSPKGESSPAPLFAIPSSKESGKPTTSPLFSIPTKKNEAGKTASKAGSNPPPLFAIPSSKESGKPTSTPLFSIPTKKNETGKTSPKGESNPAPLFAIPSSKEAGKSSTLPLFSIPSKKKESDITSKGGSNHAPLFAIASSKASSKGGKPPLFAIAASKASGQTPSKGGARPSPLFSTSATDSGQKSLKGGALFSISVNPTETSPQEERKRPALFSLEKSQSDGGKQNAKKPALFTIPINTTEPSPGGTKSSGALFSIARTNESKSEAKKTAALFSISPSSNKQNESKKPPLFSLPPNTTRTAEQAQNESEKPPLFSLSNSTGQKDGKPQNKAKLPALFSIPVNPTEAGAGGSSKKPSLFDISGRASDKDSETTAKRPALFAISGKTTAPEIESKGKRDNDNGNELADSERPKKAMKTALFDIATRGKEK